MAKGRNLAVDAYDGLFESPVTMPEAFSQERASLPVTRQRRPASMKGPIASQAGGEEMKTMEPTHLLKTYRDVVARLQHEAVVPTADPASSDFLDLAQSVEHQELARLTATRLAERARRLQVALTRAADGEYEVCSECGTSIPRKRLLAIPDATTCVACQERLEHTRS
jgi:RNA polymerase-binding transcription factor